MCIENGPIGFYLPFHKKTINEYLSDYRIWLSMRHKGQGKKQERQESFVDYFNSAFNKDEIKTGSKIKSLWGYENNSKWHYLLIPIVNSLLESFASIGHTPEESEVWACISIIVEEMSNVCGGRYIYLPENIKMRVAIKTSLIFNEFNGSNIDELAQKYRVSPQYVYEAISKQRKYRLKIAS